MKNKRKNRQNGGFFNGFCVGPVLCEQGPGHVTAVVINLIFVPGYRDFVVGMR